MIEELKFPYQQRYSIFVLIYIHKRQEKEKLCKMFVNAIIQILKKYLQYMQLGIYYCQRYRSFFPATQLYHFFLL